MFYVDNEPYYNLRYNPEFKTINIHTVRYGTESLCYLANKIWSLIPTEIKSAPTLEVFKNKIKLWQTKSVPADFVKPISNILDFSNFTLAHHNIHMCNDIIKIISLIHVHCFSMSVCFIFVFCLCCFVDFD